MNPSQPTTSPTSLGRPRGDSLKIPQRSSVCWGAIFAGATAALALHVLFMMLGAGLGLAVYSPISEENPVADFGMGAMIIHSICAIVALCFGGWVAGRFSPVFTRGTGWLHGFCVWCATTVAGVIMVALGSGVMLGSLAKIAGGGLSAVGQTSAAAVSGAAGLAAGALKQSGDTVTSFVKEATGKLPADRPANVGIRAEREIGFAMARLFNPAQEGDKSARQAAAVTALVNHAGLSQADAELMIAEWTATFDQLQADLTAAKETAEQKAREAAQITADTLAKISLWAFVGFLIGALAATWGGHHGAMCATKCDDVSPGEGSVL